MQHSESESDTGQVRYVKWKQFAELVRSGPPEGSSTPIWILGYLVWWRMLGVAFLCVGGVTASLIAYELIGEAALLAAYVIGTIVGGWMMRVSPKYEVTKRF